MECLKLTLEEQIRQIDQKLAQPSTTDDPISQIKVSFSSGAARVIMSLKAGKMWFDMRQLKANLEKQLREVEVNIKKHTEGPEESPWDDFMSFLVPSNVSHHN